MKRLSIISLLAISAAVPAKSDNFGGAIRAINLEGGNTYTFAAPTRCEKLQVQGVTQIRSADEDRGIRASSSHNNQCGLMELPNTIKIACDEIEFMPGSQLQTWSNLLMYGGIVKGPVHITGLRSRSGEDGPHVETSADGLHGRHGNNGIPGADGQDAGSSLRDGAYSAGQGGKGGNGENGDHGKHGAHGKAGDTGENNVCITLHTENFDGSSPALINTFGGTGGDGSDGQSGGHGGNGGNGGRGGAGGDSDPIGGRSQHGGEGGDGGDGGDGGNGGTGGDGGNGGDGGRIEVMIQESEAGRGTRPADGSKLNNIGGEGGNPGVRGVRGEGGIAGEFGPGGPGGDGEFIYNDANPGSAGKNGEPGEPGEDGENGKFGNRGLKGEVVENIFGYGTVNSPNPIDWNLITN